MVKHIVFWKFQQSAEGKSKSENIEFIKNALEELIGKIPGLVSLEVGVDFNQSEQAADLVLITTHTDKQALDVYQNHPLHQAVIPLVKARVCERRVVDFEF